LTLLNKHYPLRTTFNCENIDFQRKLNKGSSKEDGENMYYIVRDSFIQQGVIFFGGYANSLYSRYMDEQKKRFIRKVPDFDVLSEDPERCALIVCERLKDKGFNHVHSVNHEGYDDVIPRHIEIFVDNQSVAFIFEPIACYSFNTIHIGHNEINVATIDTMLSFYLAFLYTDAKYFNKERILCMAKFLFDVEQKNRLEQRGLLKRFSINCYGKQKTLEDMRSEKAEMFRKLKGKKETAEYNEYFFKYVPNKHISNTGDSLIEETFAEGEIKKPKTKTRTTKNNINKNKRTQKQSLLFNNKKIAKILSKYLQK